VLIVCNYKSEANKKPAPKFEAGFTFDEDIGLALLLQLNQVKR
jgi:hypothetical protein